MSALLHLLPITVTHFCKGFLAAVFAWAASLCGDSTTALGSASYVPPAPQLTPAALGFLHFGAGLIWAPGQALGCTKRGHSSHHHHPLHPASPSPALGLITAVSFCRVDPCRSTSQEKGHRSLFYVCLRLILARNELIASGKLPCL